MEHRGQQMIIVKAKNLGFTKMRMADFTIPKKPRTLASLSLEFSILPTSLAMI
jgi:hypothetical protein